MNNIAAFTDTDQDYPAYVSITHTAEYDVSITVRSEAKVTDIDGKNFVAEGYVSEIIMSKDQFLELLKDADERMNGTSGKTLHNSDIDGDYLMSDAELQAAIDKTPAPRVTLDHIKARIAHQKFSRYSPTVTICQITLDNGFSVRGESACVNVENYDREIGERVAYDNAFQQLWPLFGFLLSEDQHRGDMNNSVNQVA